MLTPQKARCKRTVGCASPNGVKISDRFMASFIVAMHPFPGIPMARGYEAGCPAIASAGWKKFVHIQYTAHRYCAMKTGPGYPAVRSDTSCLNPDFTCEVGGQNDFAGRIGNIGVAPDLPCAMYEAFLDRVHQQRLVQASSAIGRNGERVPKETDTGGNVHTEPKIKRRNLRTTFGDGKPDPGLDIIVRANRIKDPVSAP